MTQKANVVPHDWELATWPRDVYPYEAKRARRLLRVNQDELLRCGALTRPGKHLVVFGAGYLKWLASKVARVNEYDLAPNAPEHAHKRAGNAGLSARQHKRSISSVSVSHRASRDP